MTIATETMNNSASTASGDVFAKYRHPNDPRAVITSDQAVFVEAAKDKSCSVAILLKPSDDSISFYNGLKALWADPEESAVLTDNVSLAFKKSARDVGVPVHIGVAPPLRKTWENAIRPALRGMVELYAQISETESFDLMISKDWNRKHHTDSRPTMNCAVGGNGTGWNGPNGKLFAPEGALVVFKGGFGHFSGPKNREDQPRFATVFVPGPGPNSAPN